MKKFFLIVIAVAAIFMCCCNQNHAAKLHLSNQYLVGGGFMIKYTAPASGTVIYFDAGSGKHIATQTLNAGETFEMDLDLDDPEVISTLKKVGIDVEELDPILYFVPRDKQIPQAK